MSIPGSVGVIVILFAAVGCNPNDMAPPDDNAAGLLSPLPESPFVSSDPACTRMIERVTGERICLDDVIAAIQNSSLLDEDKDGIPNLNDDDIDGDGIPNSHDVDIDGDGLFNGIDNDVDADGVPNALDADVDGDFIRNRWDLDMDGDLVLNPYDRDADGDGVDDADASSDSDEDEESDANDHPEAEVDDVTETLGLNTPMETSVDTTSPAEPSMVEVARIDTHLATTLGTDVDEVVAMRDELATIDPDQGLPALLDASVQVVVDALEDHNPSAADESPGIVPVAATVVRSEVRLRVQVATDLSEIEPDLPEVLFNTDRLADAARDLGAKIANLALTAVAASARNATPDVTEAASISIGLHERARNSGINDSDAAELTPICVEIADTLNGPSADNNPIPVFDIIAELTRAFQDESGAATFAPIGIGQVIRRLASIEATPSLDSLLESGRNLLTAADGVSPLDPLAILDAFDDLGIDATDGVSETEASTAAEHVASDGNSGG